MRKNLLELELFLVISIIFIFLNFNFPVNSETLSNKDWIKVENQSYGMQWWDKNSLGIMEDSTISVSTKFLSFEKSTQTSEPEYYLMNIDCMSKNYRDLPLDGSKRKLDWIDPGNDQLIIDVINESCNLAFGN